MKLAWPSRSLTEEPLEPKRALIPVGAGAGELVDVVGVGAGRVLVGGTLLELGCERG